MMKFHTLALYLTGSGFASTALAVQIRGNTEMNTRAEDGRPNILWILADDLHDESGVLTTMPNLRKMKDEGLEFTNHVANSPLCGPSRASMLVGRLPHNSGYRVNQDTASVEAFRKVQDSSMGKWLTDAGYYTAFLGKYVNEIIQHEENLPKGWRYFGGFTEAWDFYKKNWLGSAYAYYNTSQWDLSYDESGNNLIKKDNSDYPINIWTDVHQADFLATQTLEQAQEAINEGKPFFIFANPTMVHHGYCHSPIADSLHAVDDPWFEEANKLGAISPCAKKETTQEYLSSIAGDFLLHARTPAWNETAIGQKGPWPNCCDRPEDPPNQALRMEMGRRNRTASLADLDEMLGVIMNGLESKNVLDNTYVFFSSDNGFHLGQHGFWYGKELPYDHDVRVPLLVRTPWAASGSRVHPTSHVDLTATIVELADASKFVPWELDGKSFAPQLGDNDNVNDWRLYSFSEMFEGSGKTWRNIRHLNPDGNGIFSLNLWCSGDLELFFLDNDPDQMYNALDPAAGSDSNKYANEIVEKFLPVINGLGYCSGEACNKAEDFPKSLDGKQPADLMKCEEHSIVKMVHRGGIQHEEGWD